MGFTLDFVRAVLYFAISVEMTTIGRLFYSGYKLTKQKASPIIKTTWRLFFTLGVFFLFLGTTTVIKAVDEAAYLTAVNFLLIPLPFVHKEVSLFRKYTLKNEE